jgi:hypothetical protein
MTINVKSGTNINVPNFNRVSNKMLGFNRIKKVPQNTEKKVKLSWSFKES